MKRQHVLNCGFSAWYSRFKGVTFRSRIIDLPPDVVQYLLSDGLVLPNGCEDNLSRKGLEGDSDDEVDWDSGDTPTVEPPNFPAFQEEMKKAIKALGGKVFTKLNWSSPKDAKWITFDGTLKCTCPREVFLLLKSSDFVTHDLSLPFQHCEDVETENPPDVPYQLVLRRWHSLHPGLEYRCFVKQNRLIAITQRNQSAYYSFIKTEKDAIIDDVTSFYDNIILDNFPDAHFVFDVYRKDDGKVYLVDFNPFGLVTDSLLFTWDELLADSPLNLDLTNDAAIRPVFRYVTSKAGVKANPYQCYAMPQDFVHLSTGEDPAKLIDFLQMKIQSTNAESSDEELEPTSPATS